MGHLLGKHPKITSDMLKHLTYFSAVALLGPRQCRKTTLARCVADKLAERTIYLDLRAYLVQVIEHDVAFFLRRVYLALRCGACGR